MMKYIAQLALLLGSLLPGSVLWAHPGHPGHEYYQLTWLAETAWQFVWLLPLLIWIVWKTQSRPHKGS